MAVPGFQTPLLPLPAVGEQGYFFLPEGAEGLIVVDVSRTESSDHGCPGVAPCPETYTHIREMLVPTPAVTLRLAATLAAMPVSPPHVLTQVLPQQPGQHRVPVGDEICLLLLFVLGDGEWRKGLSGCPLASKGR